VSFAEACFDWVRQEERIESVLYGALHDFFIRSGGWVKRYDHYDDSIEFWVMPGAELAPEEQDVLWVLGFDRCWLCETTEVDGEVSNGVERFYGNPNVLKRVQAGKLKP